MINFFVFILSLFFHYSIQANEFASFVLKDFGIRKVLPDNSKVNHVITLENKEAIFHANKLMVIEDYDDFFNDDIYLYFIITRDGQSFIKLTSIYKGLDENSGFFFNPTDRLLFEKKDNHEESVIIDFGIIESDGDDILLLQKIISEAASLAILFGINSWEYGQAIKIFFSSVANLKSDTRLVIDTLIVDFSKTKLSNVQEFDFSYRGQRYFSDYFYILNFRSI